MNQFGSFYIAFFSRNCIITVLINSIYSMHKECHHYYGKE